MSFRLDVRADVRDATRELSRLQRQVVPQITARALNYAVARIRTASVARISAEAGIPKSALLGKKAGALGTRKRASRFVVKGKATATKRYIGIVALVLPVLSSAVGTLRQAGAYGGAFARQYFWRGAFVARMDSGHRGVFARTTPTRPVGKDARKKPMERGSLPIKEQTVNIEPLASTTIRRHLELTGRPAFNREFRRLLALRLRR